MATITLPALTESDVRKWVGEASLKRARSYFRNGSILGPRRQGSALKSQCLGTADEPYRLEITLGEEGIECGGCSCPVGDGGHCKHAAALLLTWIDDPDSFVETEPIAVVLKKRDKAALIALIQAMIDRFPDLEDLLELPPVVAKGKSKPLDPEVIRRQAKKAIDGAGQEWGASYDVAQHLLRLVRIGDDYAKAGNDRDAATVYQVVSAETLEGYETLNDQDGHLHEVVDDCVEGLGKCLAEAGDAVRREVILRALFDVYRWDVDFGGISMGDDAYGLLVEQATPEEKATIAGWVRQAIPEKRSSWSDNHHTQVFGGLLLDLEGDGLDDESYLRVCRETARIRDLVDRLLDLKRPDEAEAEAAKAGDYDLLQLADLFVTRKLPERAERLIRDRAGTSKDRRLNEWLKDRAKKHGNTAEALTLAEALFREDPTLANYREALELAGREGQRDAVRKKLQAPVLKKGDFALLTEFHLNDGEIDKALATLKKVKTPGWDWGGDPLSIKVARKAEAERPREAIDLYRKEVERRIGLQGRPNYALAAEHLIRVREIMRRQGEGAAWTALLADIQERNKRLTAFHDELKKAKL